jgi:tRNA modification GTPase
LRLADTAGIRTETDVEIEKIGVERAKERFERAGLVFMVLDGGEEIAPDDKELLTLCKDKRSIIIVNKSDLPRAFSVDEIKEYAENIVEISAKENDGIDKLKQTVERVVGTDDFNPSAPLLTTERQRVCVLKAVENLREALNGLEIGITTDAINVSVDCAIEELSVLTGEKATETVVNEVFKNFCVGK